jgi:hypothetical protein
MLNGSEGRCVMKSRTKEENISEDNPTEEGCHHYWVIEVANGPTSQGVCKYCGAEKEFLNAFPGVNALKRKDNPLKLPKLPKVAVDEENQS